MKNKKIILIFILALALILGGCFFVYKSLHKYSNIKTINVTTLEEKINNKETFILVLTQTGCSHCHQYLPEFNRTLKEVNLTAYELNVTKIKKEEESILNKYINFSGTPTTVFYRDGDEGTTLNRISGYANGAKIKERLKSLGYID